MCGFYKWHLKLKENECEVVEFSNECDFFSIFKYIVALDAFEGISSL